MITVVQNVRQKRTIKIKSLDTDILPTQENARARYEKLHNTEANDAIDDHESQIEAKIKKAMADGKFDNLEGRGKPLDLKRYYEIPEHLRPAYHILKNAGFIPEEVRLKKEMELIKEKIHNCKSQKEKDKLQKELGEISQRFNFYMDYNKQFKR